MIIKKVNLKSVVIVLICLMCLSYYFFMTPIGALRFKIITSGYPISAFTFEISHQTNYMDITDTQIGFTLKKAPFEKKSQSELINWVVTKKGYFYFAQYYGWG